jgi:hypothetical protein
LRTLPVTKTTFKVADFLGWQRARQLVLNPVFQRRPVWSLAQKSYLIDTIVRGLPIPIIFIRDRVDLTSKSVTRDVVDGQQRLRTLFSFIDASSLPDLDPQRDNFTVKAVHNADIAGKSFGRLAPNVQRHILDYEFSTHVLPSQTEDRDVLQIFARMNATGLKLNQQELRNAQFFGEFKTLMYELALEQLERWRNWRVLSDDQIARMHEVELTSDLVLNIMEGLTGKTQRRLDKIYERYEEDFPKQEIVAERFRAVMDAIDRVMGPKMAESAFRSEVNFFTLFVFLYDLMYGVGSDLRRAKANEIAGKVAGCLLTISAKIQRGDVPAEVLDAIQRASADLGRRRRRLDYVRQTCDA